MKSNKGMTLVELLIVISILGILAAVGIPTYVGMGKRGAESDGIGKIEELRLLQEQFYAENGEYAPPDPGDNGTKTIEYKATPTNPSDNGIEDFLTAFQPGGCTDCSAPYGLDFIYTLTSTDTTGDGLADYYVIKAKGAGERVDCSVEYIKDSLNN